jgi:hypothetical protein
MGHIGEVKAPAMGLHDVARKTEAGLLGALKMFREVANAVQNRQRDESDKCEDFSPSC